MGRSFTAATAPVRAALSSLRYLASARRTLSPSEAPSRCFNSISGKSRMTTVPPASRTSVIILLSIHRQRGPAVVTLQSRLPMVSVYPDSEQPRHYLRTSRMLSVIEKLAIGIAISSTASRRAGRHSLYSKIGSSHKCMHDLAPGRSASAVGRRCGCARARYAAVQSSVAQLTAACAGPALGGAPARRQPDQTQAADSMALTWRRTVKDSGTRPRLSPMFCAGAERSLTVQPPWNGQSVTIPVSGVAGLSGSPQLLSRYRRCSLVT